MSERGLGDSPLFAVPETTVDAEGLLPAAAVQPIRGWLAALAHDRVSRAEVVHQTLDGAIGALVAKAPVLARSVDEQLEVIAQLRAEVDHSYAEAVRTVQVQTEDGTLLRGEVLARWHEFVGTGEFFRALEQKVSWLRDRVVATFRGEPPGAGNLKVAVESGLESLLSARRMPPPSGRRRPGRPTRPAGSCSPTAGRTCPAPPRTSRAAADGRSATGRAPCWTWWPTRAWASGPRRGSSPWGSTGSGWR